MIRPIWLALASGAVAGFTAACVVNLEGAPCERDSNCPQAQYCDQGHHCVDIAKLTSPQVGCELAMESLSQRLSECAAGLPEHWYAQGEVPRACGVVAASVAASRQGFVPAQVRVCRGNILGLSCGDLLTRPYGLMIDDCAMFQGAVGEGGECSTHTDCAAGYCDTTARCPGTCRAFQPVSGTCAASDLCAPGSACTNGSCQQYITAGGCDGGPCNPATHYCAGQQCIPREGEASRGCDYVGAGYDCQLTLNCTGAPVFDPRSCQKGKGLGEPCIPYTNNCARFTSCQAAADGGNVCQVNPGPGGMCGLQSGDLVLCTNSRCNNLFNGVCATYVPAGGSCGATEDCGPLGRCVNGRCAAEFCL